MRLFGTPMCGHCKTVRKILEKYDIPYQFIDVTNDAHFDSEIPVFEFDDMTRLIGETEILRYLRNYNGGVK